MLEKMLNKTGKALIGITLIGITSCYTQTKGFVGITDPQSRREIAKENIIQLLSDRGYINEPYEKFVSDTRIKTGCYQRQRGDYFTFNCDLLESLKLDCGPLKGEVILKLKSGEECPLSASNTYVGTGDGCDWAKKIKENLVEYCPNIKRNKTQRM